MYNSFEAWLVRIFLDMPELIDSFVSKMKKK